MFAEEENDKKCLSWNLCKLKKEAIVNLLKK